MPIDKFRQVPGTNATNKKAPAELAGAFCFVPGYSISGLD